MHIILFTENFYCGGMDTFLMTLIDHWPDSADRFTLVGNASHPGLDVIERRLTRPCAVVRHRIPFYADLAMATRGRTLLNLLRIAFSPLLQYAYFLWNVVALKKLFRKLGGDRLISVNGGYPGGDTCRAANIAWKLGGGSAPSVHNFHNLAMRPWPHLRPMEWIVDSLLARSVDAFVTVSRASAKSMTNRPVLERSGKVSFIYNGVPPAPPSSPGERERVRDELHIPRAAPLCLMLATYEPRKGHVFVVQAFRTVVDRIPEARLLICGHGNDAERATVLRAIAESGMTRNVLLQGFREDVSPLFHASDVLVVPSREFESFGLIAVEAMAHLVPVVATAVGGLPEVVAHGKGGFCIDKNDVASFAASIIQLLTNADLRRIQGQLGHERYSRLFTAERMAQSYRRLLVNEDQEASH